MPITCGIPVQPLARTPARFDFVEPEGLDTALDLLAENDDTAVVAGGTDLLRLIRIGHARPERVLSIARLDALRGVREREDGGLTLGALTTMAALAADPLIARRAPALAEAAAQVGSPQVRNRATIGGNLVNASPCADSAPPCAVHAAEVVLRSAAGERRLALADFMTGPGQTLRRPDELLAAVELPPAEPRTGCAFQTLTRRKTLEITIASATARLSLAPDGTAAAARVCLGSVAPVWLLSAGAEQALLGRRPDAATLAAAARAAAADASPIDDLRGGAVYRRSMVEVLTRRALEQARARAEAGGAA
jgi:carbon-monoxide dehydrogenase medium subunit